MLLCSDESEPKLGSGLARSRIGLGPRLALFWRARARHFEKGPVSIQARAQLFEKGPENWSFYVVKIRGSSRLVKAHQGSGSTFSEEPKLGLG